MSYAVQATPGDIIDKLRANWNEPYSSGFCIYAYYAWSNEI